MNPPLGFEYFSVVYTMDLIKLNMYQRLRDFHVQPEILDEIFADESDLDVLENNWKELSCLPVTITYVKRLIAVDTTLPPKVS